MARRLLRRLAIYAGDAGAPFLSDKMRARFTRAAYGDCRLGVANTEINVPPLMPLILDAAVSAEINDGASRRQAPCVYFTAMPAFLAKIYMTTLRTSSACAANAGMRAALYLTARRLSSIPHTTSRGRDGLGYIELYADMEIIVLLAGFLCLIDIYEEHIR